MLTARHMTGFPEGYGEYRWRGEIMKYPQVLLGERTLPRLLIGSSPFMGAGQFANRSEGYYRRFFLNPPAISEIVAYFVERGCAGSHVCLYQPLVEGVLGAYKSLGFRFPIIATYMPGEGYRQWEWVSKLDTVAVLLHAQIADELRANILREFAREARSRGCVPGISTHRPGATLPAIEKLGLDLDCYLVPLNQTGAHVHPSLPTTLRAIQETTRFVAAMKTLAAGLIKPAAGLPFALARTRVATVGLTSREEVDECYEAFERYLEAEGSEYEQAE